MAATWRPPPSQLDDGPSKTGLKVYNSLTKSKVDFVSKEPNKISWYNCGPTVYDASHMGHARNYVTQDILRRIMRDYFKYSVNFVMNVTDIDDKIIQRARQQHLLERLRSTSERLSQELVDQVSQSFETYERATIGKTLGSDWTFERALQKAIEDPAWKSEWSLKEEKFSMWMDSLTSARDALSRARLVLNQSTSGSRSDAEQLIDGASDVLSKWLDQQYGSTITDHAIFRKLAVYWEKSFFDDMATLGVEPPSVLTRVSDYVEEIIDYVKKIIDRGFAYVHDGSVYFDVNAFDGAEVKDYQGHQAFRHCYAKLQPGSKSNKKLMEEGEGALSVNPTNPTSDSKRSPADFALWKKSKPGEPGWESEWGSGRPGWHIECSVMAGAILGDGMDIHSGGVDLMFPHHDNEMAQSEAYHNCPQWVNYFLHTGHLHIEGLKMSKSLKNFITIADALKQYSARQLRLSFLAQRWDLGMDFAEKAMAEVRNQESTFNNFFAVVKALRAERSLHHALDSLSFDDFDLAGSSHPLASIFESTRTDFHTALCDSFNTPEAMRHVLTLVTETNKLLASQIPAIRAEVDGQSLRLISKIAAWITQMLKVFGLVESSPPALHLESIGWNASDPVEGKVMEYLILWSGFRDQVRRLARAKMQDKEVSSALNQQLESLCHQQFLNHHNLLGLSSAVDQSDPQHFFTDKSLQLDHLEAPLKEALTSHLAIWYEFWIELDRHSRAPDLAPKQVLAACDHLRDERLIEVGVALDDQDDGQALVKLLPVSVLVQAREEKQRVQREKEMKAREMGLEAERRRAEKLLKGRLKPQELFRKLSIYSRFDSDGIPTHLAPNDEEIPKSKRKKFQKEWLAQKKLHDEFLASSASHPSTD